MEYTIGVIVCIVALLAGVGVMIYCDAESSTEVGTTITLKPGVKVNDNYCYDPNTNRYEICL
ncbi:hypothetical protein GNZ01_06555 [Escherichia coli]|uniref:Uncharacterized protein n=1 Tax=Escherichia coli TaxID=562 RepID=A0AAJ2Y3Q9_ECOLX|nr:hypothetical protein [Escherichia coli]MUM71549.1 hypothetical protein [Escherichia coli]MUM82908.1 hypothetical protein [Escherichia coli]